MRWVENFSYDWCCRDCSFVFPPDILSAANNLISTHAQHWKELRYGQIFCEITKKKKKNTSASPDNIHLATILYSYTNTKPDSFLYEQIYILSLIIQQRISTIPIEILSITLNSLSSTYLDTAHSKPLCYYLWYMQLHKVKFTMLHKI